MTQAFQRGSVYWVDLDPVRGSEMAKTRPCVVMSDSNFNGVRRTVIIVPLTTTSTAASWPLLIDVPSAGPASKARIEQIRVVDKSRVNRQLGRIHPDDMRKIEDALGQVLRIKP